MADTTIKKVEAGSSPRGEMGQKYLVAGKRVSMRLWINEPGGKLKAPTSRDYETVGYVLGKCEPRSGRPDFKSESGDSVGPGREPGTNIRLLNPSPL